MLSPAGPASRRPFKNTEPLLIIVSAANHQRLVPIWTKNAQLPLAFLFYLFFSSGYAFELPFPRSRHLHLQGSTSEASLARCPERAARVREGGIAGHRPLSERSTSARSTQLHKCYWIFMTCVHNAASVGHGEVPLNSGKIPKMEWKWKAHFGGWL